MIDNNSLDLYHNNRKNAVIVSDFLWTNIQDQIFDLLEDLKSHDRKKSVDLANKVLDLNKIIKKFIKEIDQHPQNLSSLQHYENTFFPSIANELKNWIINVLEIFTCSGQISRDDPNSIKFLLIQFKNLNLTIRYQNDANFIEAKQRRKVKEWSKNNSRRIPLIYENSLYLLQRTRDFAIHSSTGINGQIFTEVRRNLSDPLIGIPVSGSMIVLCSEINSIIYCFIELIQTWLETCKVKSSGGLKGSMRYIL